MFVKVADFGFSLDLVVNLTRNRLSSTTLALTGVVS